MRKIRLIVATVCLFMSAMTALADGVTVNLNGKPLIFDQNPIIENDRTLVPVRKIFEELGATVYWSEKDAVVSAYKGGVTITLKIHSKLMINDGERIYLDVAPKIVNDRTLVPLRAVSEAFGAQVVWIEDAKTVEITTDQQTSSQSHTFEQQVLTIVNRERKNAGLAPLTQNDSLASVARAHSKDMSDRNFMSHTNPDGLSPFDRIKNAGISYRRAAENVAAGQSTPEQVMNAWMNSEGHRSNILNPDLKEIGIGYYKGDTGYQHYWTQVFVAK